MTPCHGGCPPASGNSSETALRARVSMQSWRRRPATPNISTISGFCLSSFGRSRSTEAYVVANTWIARSIPAKAGRRLRANALASAALGLNGAPGNGPKPVMRTRTASEPEHFGDLLDRRGRRQTSRCDLGFEFWQRRFERAVGAQRREQPLLQHCPHPFHLLFAAARRELARGRQLLSVIEDVGPQRLDA